MATSKKSISFDAEINDKSDESGRSDITVHFKDANNRDNKHVVPLAGGVTSSSVSVAFAKALKYFSECGLSFVDLGEKSSAFDEQEPDGFQGDVPNAEKERLKKGLEGIKGHGDDQKKDPDKKDDKKDDAAKPAAGDNKAAAPKK